MVMEYVDDDFRLALSTTDALDVDINLSVDFVVLLIEVSSSLSQVPLSSPATPPPPTEVLQ